MANFEDALKLKNMDEEEAIRKLAIEPEPPVIERQMKCPKCGSSNADVVRGYDPAKGGVQAMCMQCREVNGVCFFEVPFANAEEEKTFHESRKKREDWYKARKQLKDLEERQTLTAAYDSWVLRRPVVDPTETAKVRIKEIWERETGMECPKILDVQRAISFLERTVWPIGINPGPHHCYSQDYEIELNSFEKRMEFERKYPGNLVGHPSVGFNSNVASGYSSMGISRGIQVPNTKFRAVA